MKANVFSTSATRRRSAFTLVEVMIVMTSLIVLCGSVIMCNLYGLSMAQRQQIWLSASDDAGQALGKLMADIRSGASNCVGSGSLAGFTPAPTNANIWQQGNALKIWLANTNGVTNGAFVMYYYDPPSSNLYRTNWNVTGSGTGDFDMVTANMVMTNNMYNSNIFSAYSVVNGVWTPLTNGVGTPLIQVCLAFSKLQNPQVIIAPGSPVDFYQIVTLIASRNRP
jgi:type II secretory pathway pseudopilin PulG